MKTQRRKLLIILLGLTAMVTMMFYGCNGGLSGKAYLEERGMSAIDIVGEAKYVYDMVTYTGKNVDMNDKINDDSGKAYYKTISGEISTFTYDELLKHLSAYFSDDFIDILLKSNIYHNKKGAIYAAGVYEEPMIDYIDYDIKKVDKKIIIYKVTVFYKAEYEGKNPATFEVKQRLIDNNWIFTDESDFHWGVSPL